jgi:hypothetical protein
MVFDPVKDPLSISTYGAIPRVNIAAEKFDGLADSTFVDTTSINSASGVRMWVILADPTKPGVTSIAATNTNTDQQYQNKMDIAASTNPEPCSTPSPGGLGLPNPAGGLILPSTPRP